MKKLATYVVAITGLIGTSAFAADMPVKAPPAPPPAPVYNWTGWYVGVNAGASFGDVKTDLNVAPVALSGSFLSPITIPGFASSDTVHPSGFMGGGQIGFDWQLSPIWVVGAEGDFQGALEKDSATITGPTFTSTGPIGSKLFGAAAAVTDYQAKILWFGTARVRIGYVWGNGTVMSYVTGGLAYGKVELEGTGTVSGSLCDIGVGLSCAFEVASFSTAHALDHSQINTGWVVGYGTEGVIDFWGARNWTWKIEGLYMDLGTLDTTGVSSGASFTPIGTVSGGVIGGQVTTHSHFTDGILRVGLNYQFHQ